MILSNFTRPHPSIEDARSGQELVTITGHSSPVLSLDWSAARSAVITGSVDRTVRLTKLVFSNQP